MSKNRLWILGETLFDCFEGGGRVLGGAPLNVAWHLAGFGENPSFLSAVGCDELGDEAIRRMREAGLDLSGVLRLEGKSTGRVDVKDAGGEPEYVFPKDSAWDHFHFNPELIESSPRALYQGSLFIRSETSREASLALARHVTCDRFVDVNLREPWFDPEQVLNLVKGVNCLKVSSEELGVLSNWFGLKGDRSIDRLASDLMKVAEVENLFVTLGSEGAEWFCRDGRHFQSEAFPVDGFVDSVGAGDASASVAMIGLAHDWPIALTLERAMRFASKICEIQGAIPENESIYKDVSKNWN